MLNELGGAAARQQSVQHPDPDPPQQRHRHHRQSQDRKALKLLLIHRPHSVRAATKTATCWFPCGSLGRAELGWFTTGYLLKAHPIRLLFLVEISEARNASSLVLFTPIPGSLFCFLL